MIERLKQALYPKLLPIARNWWAKLGREAPWPDSLDDWLASCHAAGQTRSTALMLKYGTNDWNALHQDLYGELVFPLQVVINLSDPETDYTGGEFLLVEQRPRAQSRGTAMQLPQGHGYVFTTRDRPVRTSRGWSASPVRHGLSTIRSGERYAMGLIFTTQPDCTPSIDSLSDSPIAPTMPHRRRTRRCSAMPDQDATDIGRPTRHPTPAATTF